MSYAATQIPRDYQAGVAFVNSDNEDDSASDSEIERRKQVKKIAELDKKDLEAERTWMARERKREARDTQYSQPNCDTLCWRSLQHFSRESLMMKLAERHNVSNTINKGSTPNTASKLIISSTMELAEGSNAYSGCEQPNLDTICLCRLQNFSRESLMMKLAERHNVSNTINKESTHNTASKLIISSTKKPTEPGFDMSSRCIKLSDLFNPEK